MGSRGRFVCGAFALVAAAGLAACDDKKESDLIAKVLPEASITPVATATSTSTYDAAPPPPKKVITCAPGPGVDFHGNAALEGEVRRKIGKDAGTVTQADLKSIKSINLSSATIDSLDPCVFPLFTGTKDLFLGRGDLDDLSPIAPLTQLITLRASINRVSDLTPLSKMTQMDRLDIGRTAVRDIGPLANMTALTELQMDDTSVTDLSPLAGCKALERLSIRNTPVVDVSALKDHKKLRYLYIEGAPIQDTNVLAGLVAHGLKIVRKGGM